AEPGRTCMGMTVQAPPRRLAKLVPAAKYAHLSVKTLRRRIADGTLTRYTLGGKLLAVDLDEIDRNLIRGRPADPAGDAREPIRREVAEWPPLTPTQRELLRLLLHPGSGDA